MCDWEIVSGVDTEVERVDNGIHPALWMLSVGLMKNGVELVKDADEKELIEPIASSRMCKNINKAMIL